MHMKWIARAKTAGSRPVVFPEFSLTGYYLKDLAADVACAADDPQLLPLGEASRELDISAGFVERSADAKLIFFFQAEDGIRDTSVTGVQTCALPIFRPSQNPSAALRSSLW